MALGKPVEDAVAVFDGYKQHLTHDQDLPQEVAKWCEQVEKGVRKNHPEYAGEP